MNKENPIKVEAVPLEFEIPPGTVGALSELLDEESQKDVEDRLRYLLTGGLAVEVITGVSRYHNDIDLVLFQFERRKNWSNRYLTDDVRPDKYWVQMEFDAAYLEETAWTARFQVNGIEQTVLTVHPAIILVQKLSNDWGKFPREEDIKDAKELIKFWQKSQNGDPSWEAVIQAAIAALPETEQARTRKRLARHWTSESVPHSCKI